MPVTRLAVSVHVGEPHAGVDGEIVDALLALLDQRVAIASPRSSLTGSPSTFSSAW